MNQTVQETTVKKRPRLFYGWVVVLGCSLLIGASTGLFSNCVSGFIKPVCETLDVSRGAFSLYSTIGGFVGMGAIVLYGELYQRHPLAIRKFILWGCVVCCSVFVGYSFATKLWHFYALAALFGTASSTLAGISVTTLVNNWFVDKRGLATGLAFAGSGLTAAVVLPIITRVLDTYGWRVGYRVLAALAAVLILLAVWLIRVRPSQMGLTPLGVAEGEGERAAQTGLLREQALKTPEFWMLTGGFWCLSVAGMGMSTLLSHRHRLFHHHGSLGHERGAHRDDGGQSLSGRRVRPPWRGALQRSHGAVHGGFGGGAALCGRLARCPVDLCPVLWIWLVDPDRTLLLSGRRKFWHAAVRGDLLGVHHGLRRGRLLRLAALGRAV